MKKLIVLLALGLSLQAQTTVEPNTGLVLTLPNRSSASFSGCPNATIPIGLLCTEAQASAPSGTLTDYGVFGFDGTDLVAYKENTTKRVICTTAGETGCASGVTLDQAGAGYLCPSVAGCQPGAAVWGGITSKLVSYEQFQSPYEFKFSKMAAYIQTAFGNCAGGNPCGLAAALYYADSVGHTLCDKVPASDLITTTLTVNDQVWGFTAATTHPAGAYILGIATDSTVGRIYGVDSLIPVILANKGGAANYRFFTSGTSATGDGATLTMPASCAGTRTATTDTDLPTLVIIPD